jgi:hypothetical protein
MQGQQGLDDLHRRPTGAVPLSCSQHHPLDSQSLNPVGDVLAALPPDRGLDLVHRREWGVVGGIMMMMMMRRRRLMVLLMTATTMRLRQP